MSWRLMAAAALVSLAAPAAATGPSIWPVPGLYGLENTICTPVEGAAATAMVAKPLCPALAGSARSAAGRIFAASMARHFPNVVDRFAASLPASATPRAKLSSGLIASLRLTRATIWTVDKGSSVDGFLPVTLTLDITNPATGEVVFTRTRSEIGEGIFAADSVGPKLASQLPRQLASMIETLVMSAASEWRPEQQTATVIGKAGENWVIDRGRTQGMRAEDSIGADGRILFAGPNYAIVKPTLGTYKVGDRLERTSVAPAAVLARPSVLTAMVMVPEGYSGTYLMQTFEDALGSRSSLSPMPVNPGFADLRGRAMGEAQMASSDNRPLPDYVAAVSVAVLPSARFGSNVPGVSIERHTAYAFVSLIDRSARVVHSVQGQSQIEDQVSGEMRFAPEQRRDTVIRNALLDAAAKLGGFKSKPIELAVAPSGTGALIEDRSGALPLEAELTVLRPAGTIGGIDKVYYPVGTVQTREAGPSGVVASLAGLEQVQVRKGDVIALEQAGPPLAWRRSLDRCTDARGPKLDNRGSLPAPIASPAADAFFGAAYGGAVRRQDLPAALGPLKSDFANWKRFVPAMPARADRCFVPVIAVQQDRAKPGSLALTAGYTLFEAGQKIAGAGLQASLRPTTLPAGTPPEEAAAVLDHDIAKALLPLLQKAAGSVQPAK